MAKTHKLDIFDVLAAVDKRDKGFLDRQEPDIKKGFAPPVVLRWASAVRGGAAAQTLIALNEFANVDYDQIWQHPELQYKLIAMSGAGRPQRHDWIPPQKKQLSTSVVHAFLSKYHPLASVREIDLLISLHTPESFAELVNAAGCDPKQAKELNDAFNPKPGAPKKGRRA
jgi:hypothetical protein